MASGIKAIVFDFDGVILESAAIKTDAFRQLFADFPECVPFIVDYHVTNAGVSRYQKFRHIYRHILRRDLTAEKELELGERFSAICFERVLGALFVPGAEAFLETHHRQYLFFLASGTPEEELRLIVERRNLGRFFRGCYGSPRRKSEILRGILEKENLRADQAMFVGDSLTDYLEAKEAGVFFAARVSEHGDIFQGLNGIGKIADFEDLKMWLEKLNCEDSNRVR